MGALLFTQFNTDVPIDSNFPVDELQAREEVVQSFLSDQAYLQSRIVFLREKIEEAEANINIEYNEANVTWLRTLQDRIGLSEVSGSGVEILLDDAPNTERLGSSSSDKQLVQASDIRDIINLLFAADANAISINNQRVVATSPIASVGTTILINNTFVSPPFFIQAVGDSDNLSQRLYTAPEMKNMYSRKNESGLVLEISGKSTLTIPIYNGELKTDYLNLVE